MEKKNKSTAGDFHSVDFMRQVRSDLSEMFLQDREKYLNYLKRAMENFKKRQKNFGTLEQ